MFVECTPSSCDNGGHCVQLAAAVTCDCTMTSFSGLTCSDGEIIFP